MICPRCGKEYDNALDCPYCSSFNNTESYNESYSYNSSEITDKDLELFVGYKKSAYYLTKWYNMKMAASSVSWNWPAFLFGPIWMLYRKMYLYGFGLLGINIIFNFIIDESIASKFLSFAISIAIGILGNKIYNLHVTKKIKDIKATSHDSEMASRRIAYSGGVNIVFPIIFGIIYGILFLFIIIGVLFVLGGFGDFMY